MPPKPSPDAKQSRESLDSQVAELRTKLQAITGNILAIGDELNSGSFSKDVEKQKLLYEANLVVEQDKVATELELKEFELNQKEIIKNLQEEAQAIISSITKKETSEPKKVHQHITQLVNKNLLLALKTKQSESIIALLQLLNFIGKYRQK